MKWRMITGILGLAFVVLMGVMIYETIIDFIYRADTDAVIAGMESDYDRVIIELRGAVGSLQSTENTLSQVESENSLLRAGIARSTELTGELTEENKRLGDILGAGINSVGELGELNREIEDTIDRGTKLLESILGKD